MPKGLTAERVASYRANGYLYPNDALGMAEAAHCREQLGIAENDVPADLAALAPLS